MTKTAFGGHPKVDLDIEASIFFHLANKPEVGMNLKKMLRAINKNKYLALRDGNKKIVNNLSNLILVDRGQGSYDHHGYGKEKETSASLTLRHYKVITRTQEKFLALVYRHDKKGGTLVCDIAHISKCLQRNKELTDEERLETMIEVIYHALMFGEENIERNNIWVRNQIINFLERKKIISPNLQKYVDLLKNPRFNRPFDFVEILMHKKKKDGEEQAVKLAKKLLEFLYADSISIFDSQLTKDVEAIEIINIRDIKIAAGKSDHLKFNTRLRSDCGANIAMQRKSDGHSQIFFETGTVDEQIILNIVSMIRLEECLIQHRSIPKIDLRKQEVVKGIPEWYLYKGEPLDREKKFIPGYFVFNGSTTAPDVPVSKISFKTLIYLVVQAVRYKHLNWPRWKASRKNYYSKRVS